MRKIFLLFLLAAGLAVRAEEVLIESFSGPGRLEFSTLNEGTDYVYRVEWAPAPGGPWSTFSGAASWLESIRADQGGSVTCSVPMCYRVVANQGEYMAMDISGGPEAESYPVTYYRTLADVPGGANSEAYKTTHLLLRLISKGVFTMGSPVGELGRYGDETQHQVTLTKDFYIGVFEVTQKQWERVMGNWPSYFTNVTYRDSRPVERVSYCEIRENPLPETDYYFKGSAISPNWPASSQVHADSFMGKLRAKTGLTTLDLPTESQWEYACRAGTATALNSGQNLTSMDSDPGMDVVGRYGFNGGSGYSQDCDPSAGTALVGTYQANAWGLYDMHGNVYEWCLDWHYTYPEAVTDPPGAALGLERVKRGGSWDYSARDCRSARRDLVFPDRRLSRYGFRLSRTLP